MVRRFFFLFFFLSTTLFAKDLSLFLKGYLGKENLSFYYDQLKSVREEEGGRILIHLNSHAGELQPVFSLAQEIYNIKLRTDKYVIVFIDGKGVGPAAIFPFLADELIVSPLANWGDIPYGTQNAMSQEEIRRGVQALINPNRNIAQTLTTLSEAMTDPYYELIYEEGRGVLEKGEHPSSTPLVLNVKGMESLGLVDGVMKSKDFLENYFPQREEKIADAEAVTPAEFNRKFEQYVVYSHDAENLIGYLHIGNNRSIDQSTYIYVKFALEYFIKKKVCFVILDLDTPGGEVFPALKIAHLLQKLDTEHHIPVIAFLDNWAVSAGAMLPFACRFIGVLPSSLMGAAAPVILGKEGEMVGPSKEVNLALRTQFANLACFYGRNPLLAEAMVDKQMVLVLRNDQMIELSNENEVINTGSAPDRIISEKGKLLTLNAEQLMELGVADFEVPYKQISPITDEEWDKGSWSFSKLLVFQEPLLKKIPRAIVINYQDWRVTFFTAFSHPVVSSLLLVGLMIGFYIQINIRRFGIPGWIAAGCLALILLSSFMSYAINWIEVLILGAGLILLILELFVIPGFGIIGILGFVLTIIALLALMLPGVGELNFLNLNSVRLISGAFIGRLAWLLGGLLFSTAAIVLMSHFFSYHLFSFSKLVLRKEQKKGKGLQAKEMPRVGSYGKSITPLSPYGKVHIGEHTYDAVCLEGDLEENHPIQVVKIEENKVVVQPLKEQKDFSS